MSLATHILRLIVAPLFRTNLNEQFMLGARNQRNLTEMKSTPVLTHANDIYDQLFHKRSAA
jgi:hypothetical protein